MTQLQPGTAITAESDLAIAHLKKRLNEPGAFRMDDEQRLRTLLARLSEPVKADQPVEEEQRRFRHKKRGTQYTLIGVGRAQGELHDEDPVCLYRGDDGGLWVRHQAEFSDGRFEEIESHPSNQPVDWSVVGPSIERVSAYVAHAKELEQGAILVTTLDLDRILSAVLKDGAK